MILCLAAMPLLVTLNMIPKVALGPLIIGQLALKWLTCAVDVPFMYLNRRLFSRTATASVPRPSSKR